MGIRLRMAVTVLVTIVGVSALALMSGQAADSRLDDAVAHLTKAKALVQAAVAPANAPQSYFRHTRRAQDLIEQAAKQITLANSGAGS
jgi:hypothetical protein